MDSRFNNIKVLVWDFDGTLYCSIPELSKEIREAEYRAIIEHTGWSREKTVEEFNRYYKVITPSATEVVSRLSGLSIVEAARAFEKHYDRTKYLERDDKLVTLFRTLSSYRHFLLGNGVRTRVLPAIQKLSLTHSLFEQILTTDVIGSVKPSPKGFLSVLKKTGLLPAQHLMIGDRIEIDLVPAKKLGMKTCLVWSESQNPSVDVAIPTVYDVSKVLVSG